MEIRETGDEEGDDGVDKGNERENRSLVREVSIRKDFPG